jgi:hypothetical protein
MQAVAAFTLLFLPSGVRCAPGRLVVMLVAIVAFAGCDRPPARTDLPDASASAASAASAAPVTDASPLDASVSADARVAEPTTRRDAATRVPATGKGSGEACSPSLGARGGCAAGLACCQTGFHGHCGGAFLPELQREPCVLTSTCVPPPCRPMSLPP